MFQDSFSTNEIAKDIVYEGYSDIDTRKNNVDMILLVLFVQ